MTLKSQHPAEAALEVAVKLKGLRLHKMPGGYYALYKKPSRRIVEPIGNGWMTLVEVNRFFGATDKITLRQALEHDGFRWPD